MEIGYEITLEEAFAGVEKKIKYKADVKCGKCAGLGHDPKAGTATCQVCGGRGEIKETRNTFFGSFAQVRSCDKCNGTGQVPNKICDTCKGRGIVKGEKEVAVKILPGISDGQIIKIKGAGEAGERGAETGDLFVIVRVRPHNIFERAGDNLIIRKEISLIDLVSKMADSGDKMEINGISGKKVKVAIPHGFDLSQLLRIEGEGMPHFNRFGRGDLLVKLSVRTPKKISPKVKSILDDLRKEIDDK